MNRLLFFLAILFLSVHLKGQTPDPLWLEKVKGFQEELNREFADPATSPLDSADWAGFTALPFFDPAPGFCFTARWVQLADQPVFMMKKSRNKEAAYQVAGYVEFNHEGVVHRLNVYRNVVLSQKEGYADYLFLPFTDATNGIETYGGGRYIDLRVPPGDQLVVDFNLAYHPLCAYSHRFSCPIPPPENDLPIAVKAGVRLVMESPKVRSEHD